MTKIKDAYDSIIRIVVTGFMLAWGVLFYSINKRIVDAAMNYTLSIWEDFLLKQIIETTSIKPTEWKTGRCSQCTKPFRYPVNEHYQKPKTCTEFDCAIKEAHPELKGKHHA